MSGFHPDASECQRILTQFLRTPTTSLLLKVLKASLTPHNYYLICTGLYAQYIRKTLSFITSQRNFGCLLIHDGRFTMATFEVRDPLLWRIMLLTDSYSMYGEGSEPSVNLPSFRYDSFHRTYYSIFVSYQATELISRLSYQVFIFESLLFLSSEVKKT